ncbi:MAG: 4Fe-4S binding protein [Deltaproteobacteria bacterium]|nr:MAG: 4Fe-4S binding protein [Deltaproteobacteria bacterium]
MGIRKRLANRFEDFYRKRLSITKDNWRSYVRITPFVGDVLLGNFSHPVFGRFLRRLYKFEGENHHAGSVTVPINQDLNFVSSRKSMVIPVEKVRQLIKEASYRVILHRCICRDGYGCTNFPRDFACIMVGEACRVMVAHGIAREVTEEEAMTHLDKAIKLGLICNIAWTEFESIAKGIPKEDRMKYVEICLCCPCCCLGLRNFKHWYKTESLRKQITSTGWKARGTEECTGCGTCTTVCYMEAITVGEDGISVNDDYCVGCGLCASHCPNQAIVMEEIVPTKEHLLDYFTYFRPQISG